MRRLYDIANVLRSLKLIEKVHVTEERGRKPAFEWVGPEFSQAKGIRSCGMCTFLFAVSFTYLHFFPSSRFVLITGLQQPSSKCPPKNKALPEPRPNVENCAKKLFLSPGAKRSFTRHPSLIKMAKSIQDDRRKINSAPSSPVKSSAREFPKGIFSK